MQAAYFLLDASAVGYSTLIEQCRVEHEKNAPGCLLSVATNRAGTQALVKVAGAREDFLRNAAVIDKCDTLDSHRERFVPLMATPAWREEA